MFFSLKVCGSTHCCTSVSGTSSHNCVKVLNNDLFLCVISFYLGEINCNSLNFNSPVVDVMLSAVHIRCDQSHQNNTPVGVCAWHNNNIRFLQKSNPHSYFFTPSSQVLTFIRNLGRTLSVLPEDKRKLIYMCY